MRIAIDIDDTLVDTSKMIKEYVKKLDKKYIENVKDIMIDNMKNPIVVEFYDKYLEEISDNAKLKDDVDLINKLYNNHEIYIITARSENFIDNVDQKTKRLLDKFNIKYHKIITGAGRKAEVCVKNNIDLLIDDSIKHCTNFKQKGGKVLLFDSINNRNIDIDLPRVYSWKEVYDIINS